MANKLENIIQQKGDGVVPVIGGCKSMSPMPLVPLFWILYVKEEPQVQINGLS